MNTLYFEKIAQFDRAVEPVSVSIPFAPGALTDAAALTISDGERAYPSQSRALAHWPDHSIKWLLLHFQPDLPGNRDKTLTFTTGQIPPEPTARVTVTEHDSGLHVDTGPLTFTVPRDGYRPLRDITLDGAPLWDDPFGGFTLIFEDRPLTATGPVTLEIEEAGPLRVVIVIKGKHRTPDGQDCIGLAGRITAYAGKPYVEVEHQFIHDEGMAQFHLQALTLAFTPSAEGAPAVALGEGYYRTSIEEGETVAKTLDAELLLYQANEHFVDSFYGDFWADWRDARGGLTLSHYQAHQNFPKALHADAEGITAGLYPASEEPVLVLQGMAKTHRMLLHFHGPETPLHDLSMRSLQFQLPDVPALPRAWYRANNPWVEDFFPEYLPGRFISFINTLHDGRPAALGMFHFGDAPDVHYTNQGRGRGETVWVNNEYDRPHACTLFYALTGQRRVYDSGLANARHWLDVDFCHRSDDPLIHGGLRIHDRYHATGRTIPSHQWVEGFLDYYFLTGRGEALDAAHSVAANIMNMMQQPFFRNPGEASVREGGWALRAMVGMWLGTGEPKYRDEAKRIVDWFLDWNSDYSALLAPYTSHTMPRVVFMISLTVNSFARYLLIEDDDRIKQLIVNSVDDLIANCMGPDGIFYYKELPSLRRMAPTPHVLEALTYAYRISGDPRYLKIAARQFAALSESTQVSGSTAGRKYIDPSGAVVKGEGGGRIFADKYLSLILFGGAATARGLLDWYEYPFHDVT